MSTTNDIYNEAVQDSSLHADEYTHNGQLSNGAKVLSVLLLGCVAYSGLYFYNQKMHATEAIDNSLVVKQELVSEVVENDDSDYLMALKGIEHEINKEREPLKVNPKQQKDLMLAMNRLTDDSNVAETTYAEELNEEIGIVSKKKSAEASMVSEVKKTLESIETRKIVVQKGDTMNAKRIIASNENIDASGLIYEGQTIILPY